MSARERVKEIRSGFKSAFWVANTTELFERLAYYATTAVLAVYLNEVMHFSTELTGSMMGIFGFVAWFLPVVGGSLADRFGFRRSLLYAYAVMTVGYFLLGSLRAPWMQAARQALGDKWLVFAVLMIPALGPAVVKPCVAGTTARASTENVRSIGYSIYYTLVNVGGLLGPVVAFLVRKKLGWGMASVFRVSSLSVFLMLVFTWVAFREPVEPGETKVQSVREAIRNMFVVLGNLRFVLFLLIWSSFYIVFWQEFISAPLFLKHFVNPHANFDLILAVDPAVVICLQILVSYLTRSLRAFPAMTLGLAVTSLSWIVLALHPSVLAAVVGFAILALGEITQSARYYEYISRLAPAGQQGLYMGYAFLPVAIGYLIAGPFGGWLLHYFGKVVGRPQAMWWPVIAVGLLGAALMVLYDKVFKPGSAKR